MTIYGVLLAHFVADFLCQSDWMALNKSKRWDALAWHVIAYMGALVFVLGWFVTVNDYRAILVFVGVNAVAHFASSTGNT